jgi:hypothetical protein
MSNSADFFILTMVGAGFFARSFIKGREGHLGKSILFAALAAMTGLINVINGGVLTRSGAEPFLSVAATILLPILGVAVSRHVFRKCTLVD